MIADRVRVGVVGCGWWSTETHLPALAANDAATIAAVADTDERRLRAVRERFDIGGAYATIEEMIDAVDLDAVIIAVPHNAHFAVAAVALRRGLHTLLEKPMTLDPGDARELIALAQAGRCELLIDYPWHYNPHVVAIREVLAHGRLGPIEHVSCLFGSVARALYAGDPELYSDALGYTMMIPSVSTYSDPEVAGGGQGQTQVTHAAALLMWMTGLRLERVIALIEEAELEVDLMDAVAIGFEGGAIGSLSSTGSVLPNHQEVLEYRVFGRYGHVLLDLNQGTATIHTAEGTEALPTLPAADRYPSWAPIQNLVELALGRGRNGSPGEVGLAAVEFVDAMYRSAAAKAPFTLVTRA